MLSLLSFSVFGKSFSSVGSARFFIEGRPRNGDLGANLMGLRQPAVI